MDNKKNSFFSGIYSSFDAIFSLFQPKFLSNTRSFVIYAIAFSLLFFIVSSTLPVSIPILLALLIALGLQKPIRFFVNRLHFSRPIASLLMTVVAFIIIGALLAVSILILTNEIMDLVSFLRTLDLETIVNFGTDYIEDIDPALTDAFLNIEDDFVNFLMQGIKYVGNVLTVALNLITAIPVWIILILVVVLGTFFFSRDFTKVGALSSNVLSHRGKYLFDGILKNGRVIIGRYLFAYVKLMGITFIEAIILYNIVGLDYVMLFTIITAIVDIMPILGPGLVINSLAIVFFVQGDWVAGVILVCGWLVMTIIRQIIEPRLLAKSINVYPMLTLSVFAASIALGNFRIFFFVILLIIGWRIIRTPLDDASPDNKPTHDHSVGA